MGSNSDRRDDGRPHVVRCRSFRGTVVADKRTGSHASSCHRAVTGTRQLLRTNVNEPGGAWTPLGSRLPSVTAMSTSDTRLVITCEDLSVQILETAMISGSAEQDLHWQPFGTTPLRAERGIAAHAQSIYVAGAGGIHVGEFTIMGSLEWQSEVPLPPNAPKAPPPPAEVLREIDGDGH